MAGSKFFERSAVRPLLDLLRSAWRVAMSFGRHMARGAATRREVHAAGRRGPGGREGETVPLGTGDQARWMEGAGSPKAAREPRPEGFVVARIAGEEEVRRAPHVLVEEGLSSSEKRSVGAQRAAWVEGLAGGEGIAGSEGLAESRGLGANGGPGGALAGEVSVLAGDIPRSPEGAPDARAPEASKGAAAQQWDEGLGELPWGYQDDTFLALPRDPTTLWLLWDFAPQTIEEARRGLDDPRVRLRLFDEGGLVRELDLALESGSFYLNDLPPGRSYRAELLVVGSNGEHRIGRPANQVGLPPSGPSSVMDDRFATLPWGLPLGRRLDLFSHGMSLTGIPESERAALLAASRPGERLGGSESLGGGSQTARAWLSSRDR